MIALKLRVVRISRESGYVKIALHDDNTREAVNVTTNNPELIRLLGVYDLEIAVEFGGVTA